MKPASSPTARATTTSPTGRPTAAASSTSRTGTTRSSCGCSISSSGRSAALVANGAVNIEPRWSPDGSRVAYTSSAHEGLWHVFVVAVGPAAPRREPVRVTTEHESGLPRYYYHAKDQYFSPTWSPDGRELLLISNQGRIWGSGGFWRMEAKAGRRGAGDPIRGDHLEGQAGLEPRRATGGLFLLSGPTVEPALAHDRRGRRSAPADLRRVRRHRPAMVAGRRPHRLREQREGKHLALGARLSSAAAGERCGRSAGGTSSPVGDGCGCRVTDAGGPPLPARVSVLGPDGRSFAPADAWHHADDALRPCASAVRVRLLPYQRAAHATLPAGRVPDRGLARARISRWSPARSRSPRGPTRRYAWRSGVLDDLEARGWYSGDLHVHMNYGGTYRNDPTRLALQARAEDLHVVENLIVNKEGRVPDVAWFRPGPDPASRPGTLIMHGQEYHTSFWGHVGLLGLSQHLVLPGYTAYANTGVATPPAHQRARVRHGPVAGRRHRVRPSLRRLSRPGGYQRGPSPTPSRWTSRSARWTTTRRSGSWTT